MHRIILSFFIMVSFGQGWAADPSPAPQGSPAQESTSGEGESNNINIVCTKGTDVRRLTNLRVTDQALANKIGVKCRVVYRKNKKSRVIGYSQSNFKYCDDVFTKTLDNLKKQEFQCQ